MWLRAIRSIWGRVSRFNNFAAELVNFWLSHPLGFGLAYITTLAWIPFVVFGYDPQGRLYLYIATAVSLVTQFNLAMIGTITARNERKNQEIVLTMLRDQNDAHRLFDLRLQALDVKLTQALLKERNEGSSQEGL